MPLYEYQCLTCREEFEQIVSFSQSDLKPPCPHCNGAETRKKISMAASFGSSTSESCSTTGSSCGSGGFS